MHRDADVEISWRIKSVEVIYLDKKMDKTRGANLFNSAVLPAMLCANEMWVTKKKEGQRLVTT